MLRTFVCGRQKCVLFFCRFSTLLSGLLTLSRLPFEGRTPHTSVVYRVACTLPTLSLSLTQSEKQSRDSTLGRECAVYPFSIARRVFNVSLVCKCPSTPNCARQISLSPSISWGGDITRFPSSSRKKNRRRWVSVFPHITPRAPQSPFSSFLTKQNGRAHRIPGKHVGCGAVPGCTLGGEKNPVTVGCDVTRGEFHGGEGLDQPGEE